MVELVTTEEKEGIPFLRIIVDLLFLSPVSVSVFVYTELGSTLLNRSHLWLSGPSDEHAAMESNPSYTWKFVHGGQHKDLDQGKLIIIYILVMHH